MPLEKVPSNVPRVNHGQYDKEPYTRAKQECLALAYDLKVLQEIPPMADPERSKAITLSFAESDENYVVLPALRHGSAFIMFAKDITLEGKELKGWHAIGHVLPEGSNEKVTGPDDEIIISITVSAGDSSFPRKLCEEDSNRLDDFTKESRHHPFVVFSCLRLG